jgi:hypothetical protein
MLYHITWQAIGQRPTDRLASRGFDRCRCGPCRRRWLFRLRRHHLGDLLLDVAECEFQLIDGGAQFLGRSTVLLAQQASEAQLQLFVQQRQLLQSVACRLQFTGLLFLRGGMFRLALQQQTAQRSGAARQCCGVERCWHV